jgi:hypothetical protein
MHNVKLVLVLVVCVYKGEHVPLKGFTLILQLVLNVILMQFHVQVQRLHKIVLLDIMLIHKVYVVNVLTELPIVLMLLLLNNVVMVIIQIIHHQLNVHNVVLVHCYVYQIHKL